MPPQALNDSLTWRTAGGDGARRGCFAREARIDPRPVRRLPAQGAVQAAVVFDSESTAFLADMAGGVQAFSPEGRLSWRVSLVGGISASPVVHPGQPRVFVATHAGWVYALDTASGKILWTKAMPTKSDPRILSDLLYLPTTDVVMLSSWGGRFQALDAGTGAERFSWDAGVSPSSAAAADAQGAVYSLRAVAGHGVEFVRVNSNGEESVLHRAPEDKRGARRSLVAAAPVLDEERQVAYFIINRDQGSVLQAWSLKTGVGLWTHPLSHAVQATPALRKDGAILVADLAGCVQAIAPDGGSQFRYATGCEYMLAGGVCEAGGACFIGDPTGGLHVIDKLGQGRSVFEAPRSIQARPSFDPGGHLHVPASDRTVYVFASQRS